MLMLLKWIDSWLKLVCTRAETSTITVHCPVQQWPSQKYENKTVGFSYSVYMCKEEQNCTIIGQIHILGAELGISFNLRE